MPLPTLPTAEEIRNRIVADIEAAIGQNTPLFYKAFNRVIAGALAMAWALLYKYGQWAHKQIFTVTQDIEALQLKGAQYNVPYIGASAAKLSASVVGEVGVFIEAGATYRGNANGLVYAVDETAEIVTSPVTISLTCLTPGAAGTLLVGHTLTIMQPVPGAQIAATVTAITTEGEDAETLESYRQRIADREKRPPQGGALNDYILWAKEVPGVTRAFAWGKREVDSITIGHVEVYPLTDNDTDRIPSGPKIAEVLAYIDAPSRAPIQCVAIDVAAMTETEWAVEISALSPNTAAIRTAITDNLTAWLYAREPKQFLDQIDVKNVISRAQAESVCLQSGADSVALELFKDGSETATESYTLAYDELAIIDTVAFPS